MSTDIHQLQDELNQLRTEIIDARTHIHNERRRLRVLGGLAIATVAASLLLSHDTRAAIAQAGGDLTSRVAALEHKTHSMSADTNTQSTTFSGCNLRVDNGSGSTTTTATNSAGDGLGNIIIGYNEHDEGNARTGCHNLIIGTYNSYSSYSGIMAGSYNTISAAFATVTGGEQNLATGYASTVSGGNENGTAGSYSSVSGGTFNGAYGNYSSVTGGNHNSALAQYSSISGGYSGITDTSAISSSISGGYHDTQNTQNGWMGGSLHSP